jgi:hypothetical protein
VALFSGRPRRGVAERQRVERLHVGEVEDGYEVGLAGRESLLLALLALGPLGLLQAVEFVLDPSPLTLDGHPASLAFRLALINGGVPASVDGVVLGGNLVVDAGDLLARVLAGEHALDPRPHLLEEAAEAVPPLLQHADEVRPGGAEEADRLDPGDLDPGPGVVEEAGQAVDPGNRSH